ncbi:ATP-binding cassette domain-containing protein [Limosilactobacillus fastidiosus]|uniref:Energy-coupling factor transporter ATPase n=1 Tax=Limosilactobacillus fastidiosus TaxID=2759855 RepID=A0A7W3YCI0_9LACO|nr:ATP-binding cassette domain-containing protein [Limosilactobacillus fastidiosus]MBB1086012.1 energy-coupling factor transporter ATPase [Limosilactobacillus fastidiosus]MCD7085651.1 ATP-binding cassette domain-containing protein [Limosilactobacillus fastidiosus]MCD7114141.1 ATP-binding cassette domain-containing protein [Limosilactobacillus fastidiosus]MCD7116725.1 ATP-binding cassette domain-containing protein [Limosilactobacillus fastidiosus]
MAKTKIELKNVSFTYQPATPMEYQALSNINLKIADGSFTVLVGQTGSGKSTLVNLIDALIRPTSGQIIVNNRFLNSQTSKKEQENFRQNIGFVFQFPERQLFAQTVREDLEFGPRNLGWNQSKIDEAVIMALETVQLDPSVLNVSPFSLSGGQKRRTAIAGVLAMNPEVLILDEPAVGLDSLSIKQLLNILTKLNQRGVTIIMITHYLEMITSLVTQIVALHNGKITFDGSPQDFFKSKSLLKKSKLLAPKSIQISQEIGLNGLPLSIDELSIELIKQLKNGGRANE